MSRIQWHIATQPADSVPLNPVGDVNVRPRRDVRFGAQFSTEEG